MKRYYMRLFAFVLAAAAIAATLHTCAAPAKADEPMYDSKGRVLYYLSEDGRISSPDGKTKGYFKEGRFTTPSGRTTGYYNRGSRGAEREFDKDGYDQDGHHADER